RSEAADRARDVSVHAIDATSQFTNANHEFDSNLDDHPVLTSEAAFKFGQGVVSAQHPSRNHRLGFQLVEVPAASGLNSRPLPHQGLTMVEQQSYPPTSPPQLGHRQARFSPRSPAYGARLDL